MAKGAWVMRTAVMVSILAHASLIGAAGLRKPAETPTEPAPPADIWAGTTSMPVGSEELVDVEALGGSAPETPPPAAPPAPATPETDDAPNNTPDEAPVAPPQPPSVPDKPVAKDKPTPKAPVAPKPKPLAEKPEIPAPQDDPSTDKTPIPTPESAKPETEKESTPSEQDKPADPDKPVAQDEPTPEPEKKPTRSSKRSKPTPPSPAPVAAASSEASPDAHANAPSGGSFGAAAAPSVRDLGRAFTRALPPACDSDKTWGTLAAGSAGSIEVVVNISEEGKITGFEPLTKNPPTHLVNAVKRTVALLGGGIFAITGGSVSAGQQVLRLSVELSDITVSEEDASGASAFGLASRWEGKKGVASFTQMSGRHVEISVEFVRVLPPKT